MHSTRRRRSHAVTIWENSDLERFQGYPYGRYWFQGFLLRTPSTGTTSRPRVCLFLSPGRHRQPGALAEPDQTSQPRTRSRDQGKTWSEPKLISLQQLAENRRRLSFERATRRGLDRDRVLLRAQAAQIRRRLPALAPALPHGRYHMGVTTWALPHGRCQVGHVDVARRRLISLPTLSTIPIPQAE